MPRYLRESLKRTIGGRSTLNRRRIIQNVLSFEFRDSSKAKWWLENETFVSVAESTANVIRDIRNDVIPPHVKILKRTIVGRTERKNVFSINHPESLETSFVSKVFFLVHLSHKLNYRLYGMDEAANSIEARRRGVHTSKVYGFGHIYNALGLVEASVIIFEYLRNVTTVSELMRSRVEDERTKVFMRTVPLFFSLYNANCLHVDVNSEGVMLCERNPSSKVFLLDFQHAKFYNKPSSEILMFEAGHFASSCRDWISTGIINRWLVKLFAAIDLDDSAEERKLKERFDYYFEANLSRKKRMKIR